MKSLLLVALATFLASPSLAQTCTTSWASATNGAWSDASNWTAGVPDANDTACIQAAGTYTVTLDQDQALDELVVGGASGTQTLVLGGTFTSLGSGTIAPNGRVENTSSAICASCDGLPLVTGTLTVGGVLVHRTQTGLLSAGGTLDVAPGGRLVIDAIGTVVSIGQGGASVLRVRGRVEVDPSASPQNTTVLGTVEFDGGTLDVREGNITMQSEGTLRDATFDVAEGAYLGLRSGNGSSGVFVAEGTVGGDVQGTLELFGSAELQAGMSNPQLDVQGNGLLLRDGIGASGLASAGGVFLNTGLVRFRPNGALVRGVVLRNQGTLRVEGTSALLREGGEIRNEAEGTVDLVDQGGIRTTDGAGRLVNAGLLVARFEDRTTGTALVRVDVETDGGEVRAEDGRLTLEGVHAFRDATLSADAGALLDINGDGSEGGKTIIEGTLSGDIAGDMGFFNVALEAAPAGATLDVTGTGLQLYTGSFGRGVEFDGTGGVFTNVGLVRAESFGTIRSARFVNRGTFQVSGSLGIGSAGRFLNEGDGLLDLVQGGRVAGDGLVENRGLIVARREGSTGSSSSRFDGTLRSFAGSELRVLKGARIQLDPPGGTTLPAGAFLTGDGEVFVPDIEFRVEGTVSPGTEAAPIDTLSLSNGLEFSRLAGSPQLVVDVDAGGVSDRIESVRSGPFKPFGALVVRVRPGYTPRLGDTFTVWQGIRADQLDGAFTYVVADGAPDRLAFVAEPSADASALRLRVVEVAPGGPIALSEDAPVGGGVRSLFLTGPAAPGITAARLACTECLDAEGFGSIPADLVGDGTVREARFDLTSPRAYGFYDLVLSRAGLADTTIAVTVRPFLSFVVATDMVNRGIGVRPAALRYNWSAMRVSNVTNADVPGYTVAAIEREDEAQVSLALASSNAFALRARIFEESRPEDGPTRPILAFGRVDAGESITLSYGQRILPADVLFPEQTATGPEDDRIPFGEKRLVLGLAAQHASFARTRDLIAQALRDAEDEALRAYVASVDAAEPGAVDLGVGLVIDRDLPYVEGVNSLFERVLDRLDERVSVPPGLETSAQPAFEAALDTATGDYLIESYEAINLDVQEAPPSVRALLESEVARLGAESEARRSSARVNVGAASCKIGKRVSEEVAKQERARLLAEMVRRLRARREAEQRAQSLRDAMGGLKGLAESCKNTLGGSGSGSQNRTAAGGCSLPPPPPGGPGAGGGGVCTPPSAPADPNDKTANHQYPCELGTVVVDGVEVPRCVRYYVPREEATAPIPYSIQFENLPQATANAEFVTITDELDPNLDPATLEIIGTSADSVFTHEVSGQTVTFRFTGIDLPPNVEQPEGQGFVTFQVSPRAGLADGTEIRNDASIVFDFNPPIETPEVVHEIREVSDLAVTVLSPDFERPDQPVDVEVFVSNLQGDDAAETTLTLDLPVAASSVTVPDGKCTGATTLTCTLGTLAAGTSTAVTLQLPPSPIGDYTITANASSSTFDGFLPNNREQVGLPIVSVSAEDELVGQLSLTAGPNPTRGAVTLRWTLPDAADVELAVVDLLGREVARIETADTVPAGAYTRTWDAEVAAGVYVVWLRAGDEMRTRRITVLR